jgi:hypothetical protein
LSGIILGPQDPSKLSFIGYRIAEKNPFLKILLLVGGFGESPYLRRRLREEFRDEGMDMVTVDEPSFVIYYLKSLVLICFRKKAAAWVKIHLG